VLPDEAVHLMFSCLHPTPGCRPTIAEIIQLPYIKNAPRVIGGLAKADMQDLLSMDPHNNEL
jgi:hypothetical protein